MAKFNVGEFVKLTEEVFIAPSKQILPQPYGLDTLYQIESYVDESRVRVRIYATDELVKDIFSERRFKSTGAKKEEAVSAIQTPEPKAMTLDMARAEVLKLVASGIDKGAIRIRTRSWDTDGSFFGIDVSVANPTGGTNAKKSLYLPKNVEEFINEQKPTEITPYQESTRLGVPVYQFKLAGTFARSADGSYWFSMADLKRTGGIITINGKRYRAGKQQFVAFV